MLVLAGLLVVVGLPLAGKWVRGRQGPRCEFDGLPIEPLYRVRVVDRAGHSHSLCGIRCVNLWLARQEAPPDRIYVIDEASGQEMDARSAFFVWSGVVTNPITRNRVHAFREKAAAEEHARSFHGQVLTDDERPF